MTLECDPIGKAAPFLQGFYHPRLNSAPLGEPDADLVVASGDSQIGEQPRSQPESCLQDSRERPQPSRPRSVATASVTQKRRPWNRGGIKMGSMLLVSVLLHGIVLSLPMVETAPPDEVVVEEEAVVDVMDVAVLPVPRELPQPDLAEEVSPPTPSDPPAPKPQAPVRPEATAPAPSAPSAPEAQADAEDAQNPDPVPPDPIAESLPDPDPQRVGGLTLPSGGEMVNDPTDILSGAHLDRYRRDGNTDPNIEGQFLVALAANEDPRDVVEHFANELGITDSIPRGARQTRDNLPQSYRFKVTTTTGEERLLTLDPVRNRNQVLITIWREFPL